MGKVVGAWILTVLSDVSYGSGCNSPVRVPVSQERKFQSTWTFSVQDGAMPGRYPGLPWYRLVYDCSRALGLLLVTLPFLLGPCGCPLISRCLKGCI